MRITLIISVLISAFLCTSTVPGKEWDNLFDSSLSKWQMYLSYKHKPGYKGEAVIDSAGKPIKPIGYNKNEGNVFSVIKENGEPIVKISGETYGCIFTKKEYENYHLVLKFKWGKKKWLPRLDDKMDSGILYHSQGECGVDYWKSWMLSQEFQLIEGGTGDYWSIANSQIDIKSRKQVDSVNYKFDASGIKKAFGEGSGNGNYCMTGENSELPTGEWNTVELICFGDKSLYIVNGKMVMALTNSRFMEGNISKPLTKGKIQLQSEAAEIYFKEMKIKSISKIPVEYLPAFD